MKRAIKKRSEELLTKMKQRRSITLQRAIERTSILQSQHWKNQQFKSSIILFFFILESFNTNILHQLFYYKITFVNSQHLNTKGYFLLKSQI